MSVLMTLRVKGDPSKVESQAETLRGITEKGKAQGIISHHFYGTSDEVLVVDEWPDEESFHAFFESTPEIQEVMSQAGVTTAPEITFWRHLDTGDDVG